jgi:hypothetical protein
MKIIGKQYEISQLGNGPDKGMYVVFSREVYDMQYKNGLHVTSYWTNTEHHGKYFESQNAAQEYINQFKNVLKVFKEN